MATYMMLKVDFKNLSEIKIFGKAKGCGWMLIWIINMSPWCYIWCWKHHSTNVGHYQQKCCFSATNDDFPDQSTSMQVKIIIHMKKQHLLLKNIIFVVNRQQCNHVAFSINYSIKGSCWWFCWNSALGSQKIEKSRFWAESQNWFRGSYMLPRIRLK